ncbi:unnamed protein product [Rangifer tarandus platyrhynchus]|uniref:Uncharacterized protein n=2 Tax=Rangifer tarandus platyrhynchus TaxID=3082113 RepID=A0ABN8Z6K9_RANTA|nr:unnamed protein product [Rangifer tarandus platyrhynchus]
MQGSPRPSPPGGGEDPPVLGCLAALPCISGVVYLLDGILCPSLWWDHVFGALDGLRCTGALSVAWAGRPPAQPGGLTVPSSLKQMSEPASGASFSEGWLTAVPVVFWMTCLFFY